MINGIWLIILGVLAVPSLILAKRPDAKELLAKVAPYQGWIGAISAIGGLWYTIMCILSIGMMAHWPIWWATWLADSLLQFALGLILGIGTLKTFIKNPTAQAKMDETLAKLAPHQGRLGLVAVIVGVWMIVCSLFFH